MNPSHVGIRKEGDLASKEQRKGGEGLSRHAMVEHLLEKHHTRTKSNSLLLAALSDLRELQWNLLSQQVQKELAGKDQD
jgi:hypothetical protein